MEKKVFLVYSLLVLNGEVSEKRAAVINSLDELDNVVNNTLKKDKRCIGYCVIESVSRFVGGRSINKRRVALHYHLFYSIMTMESVIEEYNIQEKSLKAMKESQASMFVVTNVGWIVALY